MPHRMIMEKALSCAFTGHRVLDKAFDLELLKSSVEDLIERGYVRFYCGMAMGFDLIAAEVVLHAKNTHPELQLIACVPCPNQQKNFPEEEKKKYESILSACDKTERVSDHYYRGCMLTRDRFMVDNSDCVLAYFGLSEDGGTAYTVGYARSKKKPVFIV